MLFSVCKGIAKPRHHSATNGKYFSLMAFVNTDSSNHSKFKKGYGEFSRKNLRWILGELIAIVTFCFVFLTYNNGPVSSETEQSRLDLSQHSKLFHPQDLSRYFKSTPVPTNDCHILHHSNSCNKIPNFFLHHEHRSDFQNATINYMHVPKSGGTTIKECIKMIAGRLNMTRPFLLHTDSRLKATEAILSGNYSIIENTRLFMGDYSFGFCDLVHENVNQRKCSTFTVLREPYDRMVSNYFYCIELNQSIPGIPDCRTHTINEWALSTKSILWDEFFTDIDCFEKQEKTWQCAIDFDALSEAYILSQNVSYVQLIVSSLDKHFSVIGLTEDIPSTLRMLQMVYNLPFYDTCQGVDYNVGKYVLGSRDQSHLDKEQLKNAAKQSLMKDKAIRNILYPEIEIYKRAKEIFELQRQEMIRLAPKL